MPEPTPAERRVAVESLIRSAAAALLPGVPFRTEVVLGDWVCVLQVWPRGARPVGQAKVTAGVPSMAPPFRRKKCHDDILAAVRAQGGQPILRKNLITALAGRHSGSAVGKAAAELVRAGELVNCRNKQGYTLPAVSPPPPPPPRPGTFTPSLFDRPPD